MTSVIATNASEGEPCVDLNFLFFLKLYIEAILLTSASKRQTRIPSLATVVAAINAEGGAQIPNWPSAAKISQPPPVPEQGRMIPRDLVPPQSRTDVSVVRPSNIMPSQGIARPSPQATRPVRAMNIPVSLFNVGSCFLASSL